MTADGCLFDGETRIFPTSQGGKCEAGQSTMDGFDECKVSGSYSDGTELPDSETQPGSGHEESEDESLEQAGEQARQPQVSLGAVNHGTGTCRPCAHYWRPASCFKGGDCAYCHLCTYTEFKAYQHNKKHGKGKRKTRTEEVRSRRSPKLSNADKMRAAESAAVGQMVAPPPGLEISVQIQSESTITTQKNLSGLSESPMYIDIGGKGFNKNAYTLAALPTSEVAVVPYSSLLTITALESGSEPMMAVIGSSRILRSTLLTWRTSLSSRQPDPNMQDIMRRQREKFAYTLSRRKDVALLQRCLFAWSRVQERAVDAVGSRETVLSRDELEAQVLSF
eukprot:TRINITY_DN23733_c0_g1_i1.p1 TRINITY_DN23733_c0_g1~~TRINITY_DN23733_c0_g1_i1.p1  ORF type:complete len:336 (-),score=54.34 TRINITY_DN23733_c0_g1_i1:245-1252(-)